ncbi:hypothetical protein GUY40_24365 [Pseudomonas sp. R5(2019)]|nr:hypothetical protein [Pseudomonas sp. R5(2019)]
MIHFNTAGAGLLSAQALQAMQAFQQTEHEIGAYEAELTSAEVLDHAIYQNIARLIGAQPANIALFDSATKAWVTALDALDWHCGDRVLITPYESNQLFKLTLEPRKGSPIGKLTGPVQFIGRAVKVI